VSQETRRRGPASTGPGQPLQAAQRQAGPGPRL
jgi:hypothetical protein